MLPSVLSRPVLKKGFKVPTNEIHKDENQNLCYGRGMR
jgi:hypothetical protein